MKTLISIKNGKLEYAATDKSEGLITLIEDGIISEVEFDSFNMKDQDFEEFAKDRSIDHLMSQLDKPAITEVNAAKEILKKAGYIACFWHTSDIVEKALADGIELSEENIQQIRESIEARHDANEGINWNIISAYIDMVKNS